MHIPLLWGFFEEDGRELLSVMDGAPPKGVEGPSDVHHREEFLRKIGYKL
jgi:adenosine/AMP kinase